KLDTKSNDWGAFLMKLSYEDKLKIDELRKNGITLSRLSRQDDIQVSNLRYMIKLMDR
ncbi:degenerate transposase (orf1), partial [Streptococcus mutans SM1]